MNQSSAAVTDDQRLYNLSTWARAQLAHLLPDVSAAALQESAVLTPVSGDASFRRYFRLHCGEHSWICVDAPPDKEDNGAFVRIAELLNRHQILAPQVLSFDLAQGFMLLTDLGDRLLLQTLTAESVDGHYETAMAALLQVQSVPEAELAALLRLDADCLQAELDLFEAWFLPHYLQIAPDAHMVQVMQAVYDQLVHCAVSQPQVLVHRDYHSRNLMWVDETRLAQIDFQDAVVGPITYDVVSLLRDCYIDWPVAQVHGWAHQYADKLRAIGLIDESVSSAQWQRWFDWVGLQRHLRVLGVFARLYFRDGKASYLNDIPLTLRYVFDVVRAYPEFSAFEACLRETVLPALHRVNPQAQAIITLAGTAPSRAPDSNRRSGQGKSDITPKNRRGLPVKAMILAAGLGTRMRPLTDTLPKPLIRVNGKPLIEYHLARCQAAGVREVVINVSYLGHLIEAHLGDGAPWGLKITYSREPEPLDVVGGLRQALPLLGEDPFWCLSADVFTTLALSELEATLMAGALGHFLLVPNPAHHPTGDFGLREIQAERSLLTASGPLYTYSGLALLSPRLLRDYATDPSQVKLSPLVRAAMADNRVSGQLYQGLWSDVGTPERLSALEQHLRAQASDLS